MTGSASREQDCLTYEECVAWAERYATTPWSMLALATAADKQPGPLHVMRSLFALLESARTPFRRVRVCCGDALGLYDEYYEYLGHARKRLPMSEAAHIVPMPMRAASGTGLAGTDGNQSPEPAVPE